MKQFFILILASIALLSMTRQPPTQLYGKWMEEWPREEDGIEYIDTLSISVSHKGNMRIKCLSQPKYRYKDIRFDGSLFKFTMINPKDPKDIYEIDYSLTFNKETNTLEGTAMNQKGEVGEVILRRIVE